MTAKKRNLLADCLVLLLGSLLYAASVNVFTAPNDIAPGGLTGVATMLHYLFGFPIGTLMLLLNLPLFYASGKILGWRFLKKTVAATLLTSLTIDLLAPWTPAYTGDPLLAAIYGGVLSGAGLALIFLRGGTTGGTDVAARIIRHYRPHFSMGRLILVIDLFLIIAAGIVYRNVNSALYALIAIYASTTLIDKILYGAQMGKVVYIVTDHSKTLAQAITTRCQRGVTLLDAQGAYSGKAKSMIFCVVRRAEVSRLRRVVHETDPRAFMVIAEAGEIVGEGFQEAEE